MARRRPPKVVDKTPKAGADEPTTSYRPMGASLTIEEIAADQLTQVAEQNWSSTAGMAGKAPGFRPALVREIYEGELGGSSAHPPKLKRLMLLEFSQYLENYLWPHFDAATASHAHVMSIMAMVNEKLREGVPAWDGFVGGADKFAAFFGAVLALRGNAAGWQTHERVTYLLFIIHCFQSLEQEAVRKQALQLVSLPLWHALSWGRLQLELGNNDRLARYWKLLAEKDAKAATAAAAAEAAAEEAAAAEAAAEEGPAKEAAAAKAAEARAAAAAAAHVPMTQRPEATFLPSLLYEFLEMLQSVVPEEQGENGAAAGVDAPLDRQRLLYCERFVELIIDLLSQLPTRRFFRTLLDDKAILIKARMSPLFTHPEGQLFRQLTDLFQFYQYFPIDDQGGDPLSDAAVVAAHQERVTQFQRLLFKHHLADHPELRGLVLGTCSTVQKRSVLQPALLALPHERLRHLVTRQLRLVAEDDPMAADPEFLAEVVVSRYERQKSQTEVVNAMPLYPTEAILWDDNQVPQVHYTGETCLALPKLNLQFLTAHDYLLRNFSLFRLEATYEIREDIADVLSRVNATWDEAEDGTEKVAFRGWARMALPLQAFNVVEVRKPRVGENKPAAVTADITLDTSRLRGDVRGEWDEMKQHDVVFLLTVRPPDQAALQLLRADGAEPSPADIHGLIYVRGAEVIEVKDEDGRLMNDFTGRVKRDEWKPPAGFQRTLTVALDTAQYQLDMETMAEHKSEDVYSSFNLLMRRKPKENNFKAVLESIRDLMNEDTVLPEWLHDIFLGYGDPAAAQYTRLPDSYLRTLDFKDTFLDAQHLRDSFPGYEVEIKNNSGGPEPVRPFRITFPPLPPPPNAKGKGKKRKAPGAAEAETAELKKVVAESYAPADPGPYPQDKPPENQVRFTPVQVEAIKAGTQPGLTMVVGPPGTGKTDTAVQIMHVLYHNCPEQRTLLIAHSNQALNDLFEKILQRDVPARYLLRLGMGEAELATTLDFSRVGRVNAMLARRLELLAEVEQMAKQFGVAEDVSYTCETAAHFWVLHVLARWEKFQASVRQKKTPECVKELFPFKEYFADAPGVLFKGEDYEADMERARGCFRHIHTMFQELKECRPFELLKGQADRVNYLMTKQAKIVAMTCTHAALKRREFLELGFQFDNLLMEESAQILEIETFIPMLLQKQEDGVARLKRVILIGDHHQLPPVVKNMAFQKYSHLDQSLFTRFVRLGTPYVQLNAQGRARPSLAKLYNWRYKDLGDLPNVLSGPEFLRANAGFAYDYQFIDVGDYQGQGESCPVPYFYQNLGEAEAVVSVYQYMRLRGYPADKISILTTYNGQRALLSDVIEARCARHPAFGRPLKVTTVDKYQGQQNEYVLLSLVRTRAVGHIRDVRRLVVAMSRARLGLYVFGRLPLFANCYELQPTMQRFMQRPTQLALHPTEYWQSCERAVEDVGKPMMIAARENMVNLVAAMTREWEVATHNATLAAQQAAMLAAGPQPSAEAHPAEAAGAAADVEMADAGAAAAAEAEERRVGDAVVGEVEVMDLVPTIEEKPAAKPTA
ncbi:probable NFX1-type zinc finger-containing protein 1 at C-terminar half [Coccomyxa sp. Obi]|nr:probable NFX1-type zinc finger-containing protein 1 at C-terminar half [Coccomyxa sp. Obi]